MRSVSQEATAIYNGHVRNYRYKVFLYDTLTIGAPSWTDIIASATSVLSGFKLDATSYVADGLSIQEPGDSRASQLTMTLTDLSDAFAPWGSNARYTKTGCVVRVLEGDNALAESAWTWTFSGQVKGQAGYVTDRQGLEKSTELHAYGRQATPKWLKQNFNSKTWGRRADYGQILRELAVDPMGLAANELTRTDSVLGRVTQFAANSIAEMTPLEATNKILEAVGKRADFDGQGLLRYYSRDMTRREDLRLNDLATIVRIGIPSADVDQVNAISVIGIDKNLSEVEEANQALARASLTVGFWRPRHTVKVQWSRDRSCRAKDTTMKVLTSIKDSLILNIGTEEYDELDEFSGRIRVDITAYLATLLVLIGVTIAINAATPDLVPFLGETIPLGRILEGITMALITATLANVSSGQYEIYGTVLIPVYKEFSVNVQEQGVPDYLKNQKELKNDWINEQAHGLQIAQLELLFEHAQGEPRELVLLNDPRIEVGDILYVPFAGGLRVWVESLRKTISRGQVVTLQIGGYRAL